MEPSAWDVLAQAAAWIEEAGWVVLFTVASTRGSAPRPPGALLAVAPDGRMAGSVSGGCVEDELVQAVLRGDFDAGMPRTWTVGVPAVVASGVDLPCGGQLTLVVERLDSAAGLRALLAVLERGERMVRRVCLATGEVSLHKACREDAGFAFDGENMLQVFGPRWRLLILGAGELSRRLASLAVPLEFRVTVWDPRPEYRPDPAPVGFEFIHDRPGTVIPRYAPDTRTAVVGLLHAAVVEDQPLADALGSPAFYVGALGSHRTQRVRRRRLADLGVSPAVLDRLDGPAGLDLGARGVAEIALAIAAGLVRARNAGYAGGAASGTAGG